MKTIQMTLNEELLKEVDETIYKLKTTRSAFARKALREAIKQIHIKQIELKHLNGYKRKPVKKTEFSIWANEQNWGADLYTLKV